MPDEVLTKVVSRRGRDLYSINSQFGEPWYKCTDMVVSTSRYATIDLAMVHNDFTSRVLLTQLVKVFAVDSPHIDLPSCKVGVWAPDPRSWRDTLCTRCRIVEMRDSYSCLAKDQRLTFWKLFRFQSSFPVEERMKRKAIERGKVVEILLAGGQLFPCHRYFPLRQHLFSLLLHPLSFSFSFWTSSLNHIDSTLRYLPLNSHSQHGLLVRNTEWCDAHRHWRAERKDENKKKTALFHVDRSKLIASSPYFERMFSSRWEGSEVAISLSEATRSKAWKWCWGRFMEWTPSQRLSLLQMSGTPSRPATSINWIPKKIWWTGSHNGSNGLTRKNPQDGRIGLSIASFYFLAISLTTQKRSNTCQRDSSTTRQVISRKWHRQTRHLLSQCICPLSSCVSWNHSQLKAKWF